MPAFCCLLFYDKLSVKLVSNSLKNEKIDLRQELVRHYINIGKHNMRKARRPLS